MPLISTDVFPWSFAVANCLMLLHASDATEKLSPTTGFAACPCLLQATPAITEAMRRLDDDHPEGYGFGSCRAWDEFSTSCLNSSLAKAWCIERWCYVDPEQCMLKGHQQSLVLSANLSIHWSYETCGTATHFFEKDVFMIIQHDQPEDDFWTKVTKAFKESLRGTVMASWRPKDHQEEQAIVQEIIQRQMHVGRINNTAVVSALLQPAYCYSLAVNLSACLAVNDGRAYLPLARLSIPTVFIEKGPDAVALGVPSVEIWPDNFEGGRQIGYQFCSAPHPEDGRELIYLKGPRDSAQCEQRINGFVSAVQSQCQGSIRSNYTVYANWSYAIAIEQVSDLLFLYPGISGVIACNYRMATGAAHAVEYRNFGGRSKIFIGGFDFNPRAKTLLASRVLQVMVDQQIDYAWRGLVPKAREVLERHFAAKDNRMKLSMTTEAGKNFIYKSPVVPMVTEMADYILQQIMRSYRAQARPDIEFPVSIGLTDVSIGTVDIAGGIVEAMMWLECEWLDPRLAWDRILLDQEIRVDASQVWRPDLLWVNEQERRLPGSLSSAIVEVSPEGRVRLIEQRFIAYGCDTSRGIMHYPYDVHTCSVKISSIFAAHMLLQPLGFTLAEAWPVGWMKPELGVPFVEASTPGRIGWGTLVFPIVLARASDRVMLKAIWPGYLLNIVGFTAFWLQKDDQKNLIVSVAFLALVSLHAVEGNFDVEGLSWFDKFMLISTTFQMLTWLLTSSERVTQLRSEEVEKIAREKSKPNLSSVKPQHHSELQQTPSSSEVSGVLRLDGTVSTLKRAQSWHVGHMERIPLLDLKVLLPDMWGSPFLRIFYWLVIGDVLDTWQDKFGRRLIVPVYLLLMSYHSLNGFKEDAAQWEVVCKPVFFMSIMFLSFYTVALLLVIYGLICGCVAHAEARKTAHAESQDGEREHAGSQEDQSGLAVEACEGQPEQQQNMLLQRAGGVVNPQERTELSI